jgi:iron(III) transport system substrate-binding protein
MGGVYVRKKSLFSILIVLFMLFVTACSSSNENKSNSSSPSGNLVIYTARDQTVVDKVKNMFNEKYPDIQVDVLTMGAQEILERVRAEKTNPQADFWWGGTQSAFMQAAEEDLLEPYKPSFDEAIKQEYKDAEGRWYGEMLLAEVIMYNSDVLSKEEAPQDWDELLDPKWKDEIIIRGVLPSGTMRTIYSAMIYRQDPNDPEKGFEWLRKLDANTKEYAQDPTNLYLKLARQEGTVSLWNLQDILIQKYSNNQPFDYVYPTSGAPILVDAVGLVKNAKNLENAKLFYEFLFDKETITQLSKDLYQISSRTDIDPSTMPEWYQKLELKELKLDWKVMSENEMKWMEYWDENIKGQN